MQPWLQLAFAGRAYCWLMPSYKHSPVLINKAVPQPVGPQPLSMQRRSSFSEAGLGICPCWTLWGSWWHILPSCPTPSARHPCHGESTLLPNSVSFANLMKIDVATFSIHAMYLIDIHLIIVLAWMCVYECVWGMYIFDWLWDNSSDYLFGKWCSKAGCLIRLRLTSFI